MNQLFKEMRNGVEKTQHSYRAQTEVVTDAPAIREA